MDKEYVETEITTYNFRQGVSYGAIIGGALVGLVLLILLNMLGVGIGLSTVDVQEEVNPAKGLGTGAIIWYIVTGLIAMFFAGWVAGALAQTQRLFFGAMHGILSWCIITLVSICVITTAVGALMGGVGKLAGSTLGVAGKASGKAMEMAAPALKEEAEEMDLGNIRESGSTNKAIDMFVKADGDPDKISKDDLTTVIMESTGKSRQESEQRADSLMTQYEEASAKWKVKKEELKAKAKKTADDAADATSTTFIVLFFVLITGAVAAWFGAKVGTEAKSNIYFRRDKSLADRSV